MLTRYTDKGEVKRFLVALGIGLLAGCGGGSSGGAGGGGSGPTIGSFGGTFNITLVSGADSVVDAGPILMVVNPDGTVVRDPVSDGSSSTLDGNSFTITNGAAQFLNEPGLSCTGTIIQTGTVTPGRVSGSFASSGLNCNGVAFTLTGSYTTAFTSAGLGLGVIGRTLLATQRPTRYRGEELHGDDGDT